MTIGNSEIETTFQTPFSDSMDIMIGMSIEEGYTSCCDEPVVVLRLGFLVFTIIILVQKKHEH